MIDKRILGKVVAKPILEQVSRQVAELQRRGWQPCLASLEIGVTPEVSLYVRNQERVARQVGIRFEHRQLPAQITQAEVLSTIQALNTDPRIGGIIMQRPIPKHLSLHALQEAIHPTKDVEGMSPFNIGRVVYGDSLMGPCTSVASLELLKSTGVELRGLEAVVVGHSEIVGKPIALYLLESLATVTVCHHGTHDLPSHTRRADVVFVAVGKPSLIKADMIKPGAIVIDIGINQVECMNEDGQLRTKTVGDVDYEGVCEVARWITPVPGGVGPVTVAILMRNTVQAVQLMRQRYENSMQV